MSNETLTESDRDRLDQKGERKVLRIHDEQAARLAAATALLRQVHAEQAPTVSPLCAIGDLLSATPASSERAIRAPWGITRELEAEMLAREDARSAAESKVLEACMVSELTDFGYGPQLTVHSAERIAHAVVALRAVKS